MFYKASKDTVRASVVLRPVESKRLIAAAIREMAEVRAAMKNGYVVIIGGTTNAHVASLLLGRKVDDFWFAAGRITGGELGANPLEKRIKPIVIKDGREVDMHPNDAIKEFKATDVYIKGANAVDMEGSAGVLMSSDTGGTIGAAIGILKARGANLIVPVGLEKLVPSVADASLMWGQGTIKYSTGDKAGMMPLTGAKIVTEIEALAILFPNVGLKAVHAASGGVGGSEGAVMIVIEGSDIAVKKAFDFVVGFKNE
ncbi:MAG: hypothetical protein OEV59_08320 [Deltaproteobacteria bacterium]|nr:hypothetical protein [Deltaproteobacteria bacterium]